MANAGDIIRAVDVANLATLPAKMAYGSTVATTDGSGDIDILAAVISATGWSSVTGIMVMNGDGVTAGNLTMAMLVSLPGTSGKLRTWVADTGAAATGVQRRWIWFATGV
jgi:hypothetical protein